MTPADVATRLQQIREKLNPNSTAWTHGYISAEDAAFLLAQWDAQQQAIQALVKEWRDEVKLDTRESNYIQGCKYAWSDCANQLTALLDGTGSETP